MMPRHGDVPGGGDLCEVFHEMNFGCKEEIKLVRPGDQQGNVGKFHPGTRGDPGATPAPGSGGGFGAAT